MSGKARNTKFNVSVSVLSRTDKQQIDNFVMKPRNIDRHCQAQSLGHHHPHSARAKRSKR